MTVVGIILVLLGGFYNGVARCNLGENFTPKLRLPKHLVTFGLYRKFRHPIYTSHFAATVGVGLILHIWWWVFVLAAEASIQLYRAKREERFLTNAFGNSYLKYKNSTWF